MENRAISITQEEEDEEERKRRRRRSRDQFGVSIMSRPRSGARETVDDTLMDSKIGQSAIFRPSVVYNQSTHYSMAGRDRKRWRSSVSALTHSVLFPFSPRVPNKDSSIRNKHFRSDKRICQPGRAGREKRGSEEGRKKNQRDQKSGRLFPFVDFSTWRERE